MKKLLIILITIPLIFNSCKKEDDSPNSGSNNTGSNNNTSGSIIGTWELEDYTITHTEGYIDPAFLTETVIYTDIRTMNTDPLNYLFWVFRDNGTFSEYQYDIDSLFYYVHGNYVKNGNNISIDIDLEGWDTITVTSLTSSNFNVNNEYYFEDTEFDTTLFVRATFVLQFIKSQLPSVITEPLNKKKPVSGYNSFLNRRENR